MSVTSAQGEHFDLPVITLRFDGSHLTGASPVYYVYSDEAGTSRPEPVTVVVGVVIHADKHWAAALAALNSAVGNHVPEPLREGFFFHAKDIWSGYRKYDEVWPREARANFIGEVAAIPRKLKMALSLGKVRRDYQFPLEIKQIKQEDIHHCIAFSGCMGRANKYVRDWGDPNEVATVVAEDIPKKRRLLKKTFRTPSDVPLTAENLILTDKDRRNGRIMQTNAGPIDRIIDTIHFVEKSEAPLLQIADACAFSFRRYFAEQDYGEKLIIDILGGSLNWDEWQGPVSNMLFSFNPDHRYP